MYSCHSTLECCHVFWSQVENKIFCFIIISRMELGGFNYECPLKENNFFHKLHKEFKNSYVTPATEIKEKYELNELSFLHRSKKLAQNVSS